MAAENGLVGFEVADCVYCGCDDHWIWEPGPDLKAVACSSGLCASTGPVRMTVAEAVAAWNRPQRDQR